MVIPTFATVTVKPSLPKKLAPLEELARNLLWSWHIDIIELFRRIDRTLWEEVNHNPVQLLGMVSQQRFEKLSKSEAFLSHMHRVYEFYRNYMDGPTWFSRNFKKSHPNMCIGYFSMEYGITEALPIYSGGLGVLSGDHVKSASDLGLPMVAVGLLYQEGYFQQYLNVDGWQQEKYPINDFYNLPVTEVLDTDNHPLQVTVWIEDHDVVAKIWKIQVGRIPIYLLDTNIPENSREDQDITDKLYGGDTDMRIRQEILLGIGGMRMLKRLGYNPTVCHMNEGHSAFLVLERNHLLMKQTGVPYKIAAQVNGGGNVFTTHTPVPAGFDVFSYQQMYRYFKDYVEEIGLNFETFLKFGRGPKELPESGFNMAILAATHSPLINSVSKLHAKTSRRIFKKAFSSIPENEIFITSITNGVHFRSWISLEMSQLFDRYLGSRWVDQPEDQTIWERIYDIPDEELWRTHVRRRERLIAMARRVLHKQLEKRGASNRELALALEVLSPDSLTVGFARRFATYKRATLLLRDINRLKGLLNNTTQPIQFIFAGKAHPHDNAGKDFIRQIVNFSRDAEIQGKIVFVEDYNMSLARYLVQGVDVWLNNPRRPLEASGTSGMKAVANGVLNLSTLDGWWDEGYHRDLGWAIGQGEEYQDHEYQDQVESDALYNILENEVIPLFYQRSNDGLPRQWISMMKRSMATLGPVFNTHRMVMEYFERFYLKAHRRFEFLAKDEMMKARQLCEWKDRVKSAWDNVEIITVTTHDGERLKVGDSLTIQAQIKLGSLEPDDVDVELYYGPVNIEGNIEEADTLKMHFEHTDEQGVSLYQINLPCQKSGKIGYTVRVIPDADMMTVKHESLLIKWAEYVD